ncbi:MAG: S-layer homology domain-containing protein [Oscillospiraceae bacterium]|nr:S-layer homology domain-containing protein [Oscillospiraceae bacterium]
MKRTIAKTAAIIMAAMIAGTTCVPMTISAYKASSSTSDASQVEMKQALTIVKKRVDIPKDVSEFDYSMGESYGTRSFTFTWTTPKDAKQYRRIRVSITGGIITSYSDSKNNTQYTNDPALAKLTNEQIISKAKGYIRQLNPDIADSVKLELGSLNLFNNTATVRFERYENDIKVSSNGGSVTVDKDTGALCSFTAGWWENAEFADPKAAKSEKEIQEAYKKLCNLTPYYKIYSDYKYNEKTGKGEWTQKVGLVYDSDMHSEIDAFTGKKSTIWEDMNKAEGTRYYGNYYDDAVTEDCVEEESAALEEGVQFTPEELEKIQQDENLVKTDEAFKQLKNDKFVALTDDYELKSYDIYYETDEKTDEETFYVSLRYAVKKDLRDNYKGYKNVNVRINGETGEVLDFSKYSGSGNLPKLDVAKANKLANEAAKTYSKAIFSGYKADSANTAPVQSWKNGKETHYEDARHFIFNRYVNGIQVWGDSISVGVDSNGVVTSYYVNHTEDVTFPSADILSKSEAFDKLYTQQDFAYYYDGWITQDGKVKTYLIYKMDNFYLNAKTGKVCNWNGSEKTTYISAREVKYSDIKGIEQEEAILALQKYGVVLTTDSKFRPDELISENDFMNLMSNVLGGYVAIDVEEVVEEEAASEETKKKLEAEKKDKAETTMREAAVMFGKIYLPENIAKMNIFKSPFSDVKDTDEETGYLAVANEKGFVTGKNGKLGGGNTITRAEAVQIMYDYLKKLSK